MRERLGKGFGREVTLEKLQPWLEGRQRGLGGKPSILIKSRGKEEPGVLGGESQTGVHQSSAERGRERKTLTYTSKGSNCRHGAH